MDTVEVGTLVYLPPAEVFEFLVEFPRYANYSEHLRTVDRHGDGGPGTTYALHFQWWKLTYTAHTAVTDVDPPRSLSWRVTGDLDAHGEWRVRPEPEAAPPDRETATRVRLLVSFDPASVHAGVVDLPSLVSIDWVVDCVSGLVLDEAERVVERIVADLEGERRPVDLTVTVDGRTYTTGE